MGKSLNGKELGKGISQRKDGIYQGRFVNRFGKRQTIYATTLKEIRQKLRDEEYEDEKCVNVVRKDMTLDEWYVIWMHTCKKNCRASTKETYARQYLRIKEALGWRKLTSLNLVIMQQAFNELSSDNKRKNSKKILVDMLEKTMDLDLLVKNDTFATRAIENGMQPKTLQKLLGHGSLQMTMDLYCHVTEDTLFEAMELMECAM